MFAVMGGGWGERVHGVRLNRREGGAINNHIHDCRFKIRPLLSCSCCLSLVFAAFDSNIFQFMTVKDAVIPSAYILFLVTVLSVLYTQCSTARQVAMKVSHIFCKNAMNGAP